MKKTREERSLKKKKKKKRNPNPNRAGYTRRDEARARVVPVKRWAKLSKLPRIRESGLATAPDQIFPNRAQVSQETVSAGSEPRCRYGYGSGSSTVRTVFTRVTYVSLSRERTRFLGRVSRQRLLSHPARHSDNIFGYSGKEDGGVSRNHVREAWRDSDRLSASIREKKTEKYAPDD